ncbi:MAG: 16S rRNA (cytosine(1402)-N(4))-methyltransferase RsmH [Dehalococcoidia bacterium]|nr:16S rRNA (cytosine(1402)-N(4))-methyltransferase RsmH [Dehalococcoidia bacterium]
MASPAWHQPVLVDEVLELLAPAPGQTVVDGTVGTAGHALAILPKLLPDGRLIALDRDAQALELARRRLTEFSPQAQCAPANFRDLRDALAALRIDQVDGVLLDLGVSSLQFDTADRGFSFAKDAPLDMRMDRSQDASAETLVNSLQAEELEEILQRLGEERFARRIARRIVEARRASRITTTTELARLVTSAVPPAARHGRLHVATRTFQGLRMAVNDELGALEAALAQLPALVAPGGRAVIISFHSLEDRLVKHAFAQGARDGLWRVLTKKPVQASDAEVDRNPRARSAKLRAVERLSS